jgi:hypothetical protein
MVNTGKAVVVPSLGVCFPLPEVSGTGMVAGCLPAARSAKAMGPNPDWAVV